MQTVTAKRGTEHVKAGIQAAQRGRADDAGQHFLAALDVFAKLPDPAERRGELGPAAMAFERVGHHDIALMAVQDALELDELLNDHRHFAEDLLTLGNIQMNLGRTGEAEATYERALAICLKYGYLDDAASASTNIAILMANSDRMPLAMERLRQSLAYLAKQPHPPTEINTRLALIQAVDIAGADPAWAVDAARGLFERCAKHLRREQWQTADAAFRRSVDRYLSARGNLDGAAWKADNFPRVYGAA